MNKVLKKLKIKFNKHDPLILSKGKDIIQKQKKERKK